ncbi:MAG TPA: nucleoside hydrolase [Vicinamibacteria bacterium]|nr:nucleoside hydrolase [Vicinamibacteria bacterium]
MRRFLIDTDTASDDAVALVMALRAPDVRVEAVTVVAGNVPLAQGVQNALYTVELCGSSAPVFAGRAAPLTRTLETAQQVHGRDGMGEIGLPLHGRRPAPGEAADVIVDAARRWPGELTLVALGPLTNLAVALRREPRLAREVGRCVVMGGASDSVGNVTPVSEYNFWVDPEAAAAVLGAGLPLTLVGWDISRKYAVLDAEAAARLREVGTPLARFCVDIQNRVERFAREEMKLDGFDLPDPIAMAVALDPGVVTSSARLHVAVETSDGLCRGQTVVDRLGVLRREPNVDVVLAASRERFLERLHAAVGDGRWPAQTESPS